MATSDLAPNMETAERIYEVVIEFVVTYSFQIIGALIIFGAGVVVAGWASNVLQRVLERRNVDVTLRIFIAGAAKLLLIGLAGIIALGNLGISITPFIAAIGGLAVGASLAIQGPISNYGSGLIVILTRMYRVGDTITVQACSGVVTEISLATTRLKAEDGEDIIIPNRQIVGEIHRNSYANRIVEGRVGIAYGENANRAVEIIRAVIAGHDGIAPEPRPLVGIEAFGEWTIHVGYRVWMPTRRYFELMYSLNLAVLNALDAEGIKLVRRFDSSRSMPAA